MTATICRAGEKIEALGARGILVSLIYGECGDSGNMWTVAALLIETGATWERPMACFSLEHCADVAIAECHRLKWI